MVLSNSLEICTYKKNHVFLEFAVLARIFCLLFLIHQHIDMKIVIILPLSLFYYNDQEDFIVRKIIIN